MIDLSKVPNDPGCYLFKDAQKKILYIGKAKSLQKRVKSYFQKNDHDEKTKLLVKNIHEVDCLITNTEVEALILENNLIKKYKPRFNIDLKDAKRYAYIEITNEDFPKLNIARKIKDGSYFGPFVSAATRDYVLHALRKTFKIRTSKKFPKKPCLRYHLNLCDAPCANKISKEKYTKKMDAVSLVLKGKTKDVIKGIEKQMKKASENKEYEQALAFRNQIHAIESLKEKQNMERQKTYDEDIINYHVGDGTVHLMLFNAHNGILENKQEFEFQYHNECFEEFLLQYYADNRIPKEIIVPIKVSDAIKEYLLFKRKNKVNILIPKIGEKKQLLDLVKKNIEVALYGEMSKLEDLKEKLNLGVLPEVIECFDISHLAGKYTVASMVQFRNAKPDKNNYRRFKINTVEGIDDYKSIKEVVRRRYSRLLKENATLPNLIVIDGGKGQLSAALEELNILNLEIPIISLAKKFEEVFILGVKDSLKLNKKGKALKLLQEVRDEAHRFAIKYNRLLRTKGMKK